MSDTESKPLPRNDADAVGLDLVWAATFAAAFVSAGRVDDVPGARLEFGIDLADRAVAALVKRRAR